MCDTWCNIADVHEKAGHDYEQIKDAYIKALGYAEQSGKLSSVVGFIINFAGIILMGLVFLLCIESLLNIFF